MVESFRIRTEDGELACASRDDVERRVLAGEVLGTDLIREADQPEGEGVPLGQHPEFAALFASPPSEGEALALLEAEGAEELIAEAPLEEESAAYEIEEIEPSAESIERDARAAARLNEISAPPNDSDEWEISTPLSAGSEVDLGWDALSEELPSDEDVSEAFDITRAASLNEEQEEPAEQEVVAQGATEELVVEGAALEEPALEERAATEPAAEGEEASSLGEAGSSAEIEETLDNLEIPVEFVEAQKRYEERVREAASAIAEGKEAPQLEDASTVSGHYVADAFVSEGYKLDLPYAIRPEPRDIELGIIETEASEERKKRAFPAPRPKLPGELLIYGYGEAREAYPPTRLPPTRPPRQEALTVPSRPATIPRDDERSAPAPSAAPPLPIGLILVALVILFVLIIVTLFVMMS